MYTTQGDVICNKNTHNLDAFGQKPTINNNNTRQQQQQQHPTEHFLNSADEQSERMAKIQAMSKNMFNVSG